MTELEEIRAAIRKFRDERDWMQFHSPKNLACRLQLKRRSCSNNFSGRRWKKVRPRRKTASMRYPQKLRTLEST